jgi:hypothetical protein
LLWPQWFIFFLTIGTLPDRFGSWRRLLDADRQLSTQPCAAIRRAILPEAQMLYLADPVGRRAGVAQW